MVIVRTDVPNGHGYTIYNVFTCESTTGRAEFITSTGIFCSSIKRMASLNKHS
jgi:hypothetical protein